MMKKHCLCILVLNSLFFCSANAQSLFGENTDAPEIVPQDAAPDRTGGGGWIVNGTSLDGYAPEVKPAPESYHLNKEPGFRYNSTALDGQVLDGHSTESPETHLLSQSNGDGFRWNSTSLDGQIELSSDTAPRRRRSE